MRLDKERVLPIIRAALKEDIGRGDITTSALINKFSSTDAAIITNEDCVISGLEIAEWVMNSVDYSVRFKPNCGDGDLVGASKEILFLEGHSVSILRAERTMLNFLTMLSGIATKTRKFVDIVKPYGTSIVDTRKTIPLLRYLEKYAVASGGGKNHRMGLYDQVLIKDNHIAVSKCQSIKVSKKAVTLKDLVLMAREKNLKGAKVEIEVTTIREFEEVLSSRPDIVMLDNMKPEEVRACVEIRRLARVKPLLEVSGGINLENVIEYAKTKVDMISIGCLTGSVKSIDMSLGIS